MPILPQHPRLERIPLPLSPTCNRPYNAAMSRRQLLRHIFILAILLCLIGWGWSLFYRIEFQLANQNRMTSFGAMSGGLYFAKGRTRVDFSDNHSPPKYEYYLLKRPLPFRLLPGGQLLGFACQWGGTKILKIPYWFLILLFSIPLYFLRPGTRPKKEAAFPVIMNRKSPPHS
jgi:hypothetical protein